jgi:GTPase SAR1 family protein
MNQHSSYIKKNEKKNIYKFIKIFVIMNFKITLYGKSGTGKTSFTNYLIGKNFNEIHIKTLGYESQSVNISTNCGFFNVNIFDTAGDTKYMGLGEGYGLGSDMIIFFHSNENSEQDDDFEEWYHSYFKDGCGNITNIATFHVNNKIDLSHNCEFDNINNTPSMCMGISSKTGFGIVDLLTNILRELTNNNHIEIFFLRKNNSVDGLTDYEHSY